MKRSKNKVVLARLISLHAIQNASRHPAEDAPSLVMIALREAIEDKCVCVAMLAAKGLHESAEYRDAVERLRRWRRAWHLNR